MICNGNPITSCSNQFCVTFRTVSRPVIFTDCAKNSVFRVCVVAFRYIGVTSDHHTLLLFFEPCRCGGEKRSHTSLLLFLHAAWVNYYEPLSWFFRVQTWQQKMIRSCYYVTLLMHMLFFIHHKRKCYIVDKLVSPGLFFNKVSELFDRSCCFLFFISLNHLCSSCLGLLPR